MIRTSTSSTIINERHTNFQFMSVLCLDFKIQAHFLFTKRTWMGSPGVRSPWVFAWTALVQEDGLISKCWSSWERKRKDLILGQQKFEIWKQPLLASVIALSSGNQGFKRGHWLPLISSLPGIQTWGIISCTRPCHVHWACEALWQRQCWKFKRYILISHFKSLTLLLPCEV